MKKVVMFANTGFFIANFRSELVANFQKRKIEVVVICKEDAHCGKLAEMGVKLYLIPLSRHGINPIKELKILMHLRKILREEKPDLLINYTIKPNIYGTFAGKLAKLPMICSTVTGLGFVFTGNKIKRKVFRKFMRPLYGLALKMNRLVFFENKDDSSFFTKLGLVDKKKVVLLNGSGVNVKKFHPKKTQKEEASFIMVSRLLWDKGVREYVEASRLLKKKYAHAKFYLLGPFDENPSAITKEQVENWQQEGAITYLGAVMDVRPYLEKFQVCVLPSYREGTPKAILESMAMGLAVVTTDVPGCREPVRHGHNGYLVPVENVEQLSEAMEKFILNPKLANMMGAKGVEIVKQRYDVRKVNGHIFSNLQEAVVQ